MGEKNVYFPGRKKGKKGCPKALKPIKKKKTGKHEPNHPFNRGKREGGGGKQPTSRSEEKGRGGGDLSEIPFHLAH